ncbi:MAG TPA: MarR family transcriptional regulator [Lachnospiraceae bacterium]|nr:MarR family transcriptional regulator [Lachnospiraceae bacterium]
MYTEYEIVDAGVQVKRRMERYCEKLMEQTGLRKIELDLLFFLAHSSNQNTAHDLAVRQHISKAHISKSIEHLKLGEYIVLVPDAQDHRCIRIELTAQSESLIKEYELLRHQFLQELFDGVTEDEINALKCVLYKILQNVRIEDSWRQEENEETINN